MSGGPKFFEFRTWAKPSSAQAINGDKLHSPSNPEVVDRRTSVKIAQFFILTALLFVLADYVGRVQDRTDANFVPDSKPPVQLILSPAERSGNGPGFTVRFSLSNKGNHSVFYPADTTTRVPVGQLVSRASATSDWMSLSGTSKQLALTVENFGDSTVNWIEMPPGGWVDGDFQDVGVSSEEHAYVICVKVAREGNGIRIVSRPYSALANQ